MANKRIALSNKIRFEIFKRDSFKCQYCGRSAPDVVLNVDHITPVSKGGTNDVFNLITSCFECNNGKRSKKLTSKTEITKQKEQLDILNERRIQLEMLLEWKGSLIKSSENDAIKIGKYIIKKLGAKGHSLSDTGIMKIKAFLKKLSINRLIEIIDETIDSMADNVAYYGIDDKTFEILFSILNAKYRSETATKSQKIQYILNQLIRRFHYISKENLDVIKENLSTFFDIQEDLESYQEVQSLVKKCTLQELYDFIHYEQ